MVTSEVAVVVTGALGSGKTTLARQLAEHLRATLLSKDLLKESMYEPLGLTTDRRSLRASGAAMRLIYDLAATSHAPLVLEANWKDLDIPQLQSIGRPLVQVFCDAPTEILRRRVRDRVRTGERHPVHRDRLLPELLDSVLASLARPRQPLTLACPTLEVDTAEALDVEAVAAWVRTSV